MNDNDKGCGIKDIHIWQFAFVRDIVKLLGLLVLLWIVYSLRALLWPVLLGLLLAYIVNPLIEKLSEKWKWPRILSMTIFTLLALLLIAALMIWLVPLAINQVIALIRHLPGYIERLVELLPVKEGQQQQGMMETLRQNLETLAQNPQQLLQFLWQGTAKSLNVALNVFGATAYYIMAIILMLMFFFTFSLHFPGFKKWTTRCLPVKSKDRVIKTLNEINNVFGTFFRVRLIIALIMGAMLSLGWAIAGVPYWFLLGMFSGLLSLIPYAASLGWLVVLAINVAETYTGTAPGAMQIFYALLWPTVVYCVVQGIEGWILTPVMQGGEMDMNPAVVVLVVAIGGSTAGLLGMLLAIPVTACLHLLFDQAVKPRLMQWAQEN